MFENDSKNHHYIAQVQQKMNAINPDLDKKKRKIYKFKVVDKESSELSLIEEEGVLIESNLSFQDLYTFKVLGYKYRKNFEKLFKVYEDNLEKYSKEFFNKINRGEDNITLEIANIFLYHFMNMVRNPLTIKDSIILFDSVIYKYIKSNMYNHEELEEVQNIENSDIEKICYKYSINKEEYKKWMLIIFLFVGNRKDNKEKLIESVVKNIFNNKNSWKEFTIGCYSGKNYCLLSDKGYNMYSTNDAFLYFDINVMKNVFINLVLVKNDAIIDSNLISEMQSSFGFDDEQVKYFKEYLKNTTFDNMLSKNIKANLIRDDLLLLASYNQRTIQNCHEHVFGASKKYEGVTLSL